MKKALTILVTMMILLFPLSAETAFWIGFDPADSSWDNSQLLAFTSLYEEGSEIIITSNKNLTASVTVFGSHGESVEGRDLALTREALEKLGLWGEGHSLVSVKLRKGAVVEEGEEISYAGSGWYSFVLSPISLDKAYSTYRNLISKGFKPETIVNEDKTISFTLPYIAEYERDEKRRALTSLGLQVENEKPSKNPYL